MMMWTTPKRLPNFGIFNFGSSCPEVASTIAEVDIAANAAHANRGVFLLPENRATHNPIQGQSPK